MHFVSKINPSLGNRFCAILIAIFVLLLEIALPIKAQTTVEQIEALLAEYHKYGLFNGSVLISEGGKLLYKGGFGKANRDWNIPNTADTKFRIGSTTKQFTAALVLSLVEDGKLELKGTVLDYLPDYPEEQGKQISIHQLLTHSSGIPSYTTPDFMSNEVRNPFTPDSLLALFADLELQFKPGTKWAYSNSGYILLGAIIEAVTQKPYAEVLRQRILSPLGLKDTGYDHYNEVLQKRATGYVRTPAGYERAPYLDTSVPYSAGMLHSTVEDLYKWDQLLYSNGPFLQKETKDLLFTPHITLPEGMAEQVGLPPSYGYGWFVGNVPVGDDTIKVIEHGGNIFGFATGFWRMPEGHNTVIIMDNSFSREVRNIGKGIISILYGYTATEPKEPVSNFLHEIIKAEGIETAKIRYKQLFETRPDKYNFQETELNKLGYYYMNTGEMEWAIEVLKLNTESYPKSANSYDSLGEAYMKVGDNVKAIENYKKSLEINPDNTNALRMIEHLEGEMNKIDS